MLTFDLLEYHTLYPEAKRLQNYVLSTDIPACQDLIENGKYGGSIAFNDDVLLAKVLNEIVTGERNIDVYEGYDMNELFWGTKIKKLKLL